VEAKIHFDENRHLVEVTRARDTNALKTSLLPQEGLESVAMPNLKLDGMRRLVFRGRLAA
jgi:hypothetical protein